jgi:hypothetical protein
MVFLGLIFLLPCLSFGSPAEDPEERSISFLDQAQNLFGNRLNNLANRLDAFFATDRADDEFGRSTLRVRGTYLMKEREVGEFNTRYRLNMRLPNLEEKFRFRYFQEDKDKAAVLEQEEERIRLRKLNEVKRGWLFNADAGVSVGVPPRFTTRARLRRSFETGDFIHRFVEQLTYTTDSTGLQEETSLDSDYRINERLLFRFQNIKRWYIINKDFDTSHGPQLLHSLTEDDAINYSFITTSIINDGVWYLTGHNLSIQYRRNLYKQWLYSDIIPGVEFPKQWSFRRTPYLFVQIEALFGNR